LRILSGTCTPIPALAHALQHLHTLSSTCTCAHAFRHLHTLSSTCTLIPALPHAFQHVHTLSSICTLLLLLLSSAGCQALIGSPRNPLRIMFSYRL
jgi:hypothetical protein